MAVMTAQHGLHSDQWMRAIVCTSEAWAGPGLGPGLGRGRACPVMSGCWEVHTVCGAAQRDKRTTFVTDEMLPAAAAPGFIKGARTNIDWERIGYG